MVEDIAGRGGVRDARVLEAMRGVPRHEFIPTRFAHQAYADATVPIGHGQTTSRPHIVAIMAELARIGPDARVLEIGTGSGYGAAVLAGLAAEVFTIEILEPLGAEARERLARLGYSNVSVRIGDGYRGWPEAAPFDAIVVTAAPPSVPVPLKEQLKVGGKLVIPVGTDYQWLRVVTRTADGFEEKPEIRVEMEPMTGVVQEREPD